ncbi:MAG: trigger factor [Isosphaeraceae bacterium]
MSTQDPGHEHEEAEATATEAAEKPERRLDLAVEIEDAGPCKKHIKVSVPRSDIDIQFDEALVNLRKEAVVPGFRVGRAPKHVVGRRFRKEVAEQVKSQLVMTSIQQIEKEYEINAISEPDLDVAAIGLPDTGPMSFEMNVEVQPEFDLPQYDNITVRRPITEVTDDAVDRQLQTFLERYAQVVPKIDGSVESGDIIVADVLFEYEGVQYNKVSEAQFRVTPTLRIPDGVVNDLDKALAGAKAGESRSATGQIGSGSPDAALRGKSVTVHFIIHDIKQLRMPETDATFLNSIGFESLDELRTALRGVLERRMSYNQRQAMRRSLLDQLHDRVKFELPTDLVARQERSIRARLIQEYQEAGLNEREIRAREAELRANAHEITLRTLKDFFLLSKIAKAEGLSVEEDDIDQEIEVIAARTDESPRRVRARIQKGDEGANLIAQIAERR